MKEYNFINQYGEIETVTNLAKFGEKHNIYDLTWTKLNTWKPKHHINKTENDFFKKYNLNTTVFNIACLQRLGRVFIYEFKLKELRKEELNK